MEYCLLSFSSVTITRVREGQSKAIERFVAGQHGFMGSTPLEAAQIDMICEHVFVSTLFL